MFLEIIKIKSHYKATYLSLLFELRQRCIIDRYAFIWKRRSINIYRSVSNTAEGVLLSIDVKFLPMTQITMTVSTDY